MGFPGMAHAKLKLHGEPPFTVSCDGDRKLGWGRRKFNWRHYLRPLRVGDAALIDRQVRVGGRQERRRNAERLRPPQRVADDPDCLDPQAPLQVAVHRGRQGRAFGGHAHAGVGQELGAEVLTTATTSSGRWSVKSMCASRRLSS